MRKAPRGKSPLDPHPWLPPGTGPRAQLGLGQGQEAGVPSFLVVCLPWEGIKGGDLHVWVLLHSGTAPQTHRPVEAEAVEIKPACWPRVCLCS